MLYLNSQRKYLNEAERIQFYQAAKDIHTPFRFAFCLLILDTGCRMSEALNLRVQDIDFSESVLIIHTLKQRKEGAYRVMPVAPELLELLSAIITEKKLSSTQRLWPYGRTTGWKWIKKAMAHAGLDGIKATARGLRHGFGIACAQSGLDVTNIQDLMGHVKLETTKIYLKFVGKEQRTMVSKTWARPKNLENSLSKITPEASVKAEVNRMSYSVHPRTAIGFCFGNRLLSSAQNKKSCPRSGSSLALN